MEEIKEVTSIQDEDLLRKMWQTTEDFSRRKEIRAHMYKLREARLKEFYTSGEVLKDVQRSNSSPGLKEQPCMKDEGPTHADSLADHSFLSLKTKEIRDSESPTRDVQFRNSKNRDADGQWTIHSSKLKSADGKTLTSSQIATTQGVRAIDNGQLAYAASNEHQASVFTDGDDKNYTRAVGESSKTFAAENIVSGDENNFRSSKSTTKSSSSRIVTESKSTSGDFRGFDDKLAITTGDETDFICTDSKMATNASENIVKGSTTTYTSGEIPEDLKKSIADGSTKVYTETKTLADGSVVTTTRYETRGSKKFTTGGTSRQTLEIDNKTEYISGEETQDNKVIRTKEVRQVPETKEIYTTVASTKIESDISEGNLPRSQPDKQPEIVTSCKPEETYKPSSPTEGQYSTTYRSEFTNKRISVDVSATHDAFARSLRSVSPDRIGPKSTRTSTTSLRSGSTSPDKQPRGRTSPERKMYDQKRHNTSPNRDNTSPKRDYTSPKKPEKSPERKPSRPDTITITKRRPSSDKTTKITKSTKPGERTSPLRSPTKEPDLKTIKSPTKEVNSDTITRKKKVTDEYTVNTDTLIKKKNITERPISQDLSPTSLTSDFEYINHTKQIITDLDEPFDVSVITKKEIKKSSPVKDVPKRPNFAPDELVSPSEKPPTTFVPDDFDQICEITPEIKEKPPLRRTETYEERCRQMLGLPEPDQISKKDYDDTYAGMEPVEEPMMMKKTVYKVGPDDDLLEKNVEKISRRRQEIDNVSQVTEEFISKENKNVQIQPTSDTKPTKQSPDRKPTKESITTAVDKKTPSPDRQSTRKSPEKKLPNKKPIEEKSEKVIDRKPSKGSPEKEWPIEETFTLTIDTKPIKESPGKVTTKVTETITTTVNKKTPTRGSPEKEPSTEETFTIIPSEKTVTTSRSDRKSTKESITTTVDKKITKSTTDETFTTKKSPSSGRKPSKGSPEITVDNRTSSPDHKPTKKSPVKVTTTVTTTINDYKPFRGGPEKKSPTEETLTTITVGKTPSPDYKPNKESPKKVTKIVTETITTTTNKKAPSTGRKPTRGSPGYEAPTEETSTISGRKPTKESPDRKPKKAPIEEIKGGPEKRSPSKKVPERKEETLVTKYSTEYTDEYCETTRKPAGKKSPTGKKPNKKPQNKKEDGSSTDEEDIDYFEVIQTPVDETINKETKPIHLTEVEFDIENENIQHTQIRTHRIDTTRETSPKRIPQKAVPTDTMECTLISKKPQKTSTIKTVTKIDVRRPTEKPKEPERLKQRSPSPVRRAKKAPPTSNKHTITKTAPKPTKTTNKIAKKGSDSESDNETNQPDVTVPSIKRSTSSREASPDKVWPVSSEDEGSYPRYPDKVSEPDDSPSRRKTILTEEEDESLLTVTEKVSKFITTAEKLSEVKAPAPKVPRPELIIDEKLENDECLLSVSDKVSKFVSVQESPKSVKPKDETPIEIKVNENDECLLSVNQKVSHFIQAAETSKKVPTRDGPAPKVSRPELDIDETLRTDDCILSVSDKVNKFTETKKTEIVCKSPDKVTKVEITLQQEPTKRQESLKSSEAVRKAKAMFENISKQEKPKQIDILSRPSIFEKKPKPEDDVKLTDIGVYRKKDDVKKQLVYPNETTQDVTLKSTKLILEESKDRARISPEKDVCRTGETPHYMQSIQKHIPNEPNRSNYTPRTVKPGEKPHYMSPIQKHPTEEPERLTDRTIRPGETPHYMQSIQKHIPEEPDKSNYTPRTVKPGQTPHYMSPLQTHPAEEPNYVSKTIKPGQTPHYMQSIQKNIPEEPDRSNYTSRTIKPGEKPHYMSPLETHPVEEPNYVSRPVKPAQTGQTPHYMRPIQGKYREATTPEKDMRTIKERYPENGNTPHYMQPLDRTISPERDNKIEEKVQEILEDGTRAEKKFGVTLRRTDSGRMVNITERRRSSTPGQPIIEEIQDLEVLEQMMDRVVGYEQRSRIRAQIRVVKKIISENKIQKRTKIQHSTNKDSPVSKFSCPNDDNIKRSTTSPIKTIEKVERPRQKSPESKTQKTEKITRSSKERSLSPELKKPAMFLKNSTKSDDKPSWVTNRNLKKTSTSTETVQKRTISSSKKIDKKRSPSPQKETKPMDCITSSYGIGPTDENGLPLFGIRALRKAADANKVQIRGTVVTSQYYSENGQEPVGEVSVTEYSNDPKQLNINDENIGRNKGITSVTMTQKFGSKGTPTLTSLVDKKRAINDKQSEDEILKTTSTKVTRRGSVKALSQKFIENAVETAKNEKNAYPKAGLILRTSSFKNSAERSSSRESSPGYTSRPEKISLESLTSASCSQSEHISSTTTKTFLNSHTKVANAQEVITRMKNAETENIEGDSADDREARMLLNKFLGAQVLMSGIEQSVSSTATSSSQFVRKVQTKSSSSTTTKEPSKPLSLSKRFQTPITAEVLQNIWDEQTLRALLEQCTDYEERRAIRARLRQVMAEQEAVANVVASAVSDSTQERIETTKKTFSEGPVSTTQTSTTTKVVQQNRQVGKPISPFAKFRQLDKQNSLNTPPSSPKTPTGAPLFKFTDPALCQSASTVKERLLHWCQMKTKEYENIKLDNFSTSWADGMAFCALIHHFLPEAFDYHALNPKQRRHNFTLAFKVADEQADIAPLLDVDDMVAMRKPDWKCVFTYVQSIYRRFKDDD